MFFTDSKDLCLLKVAFPHHLLHMGNQLHSQFCNKIRKGFWRVVGWVMLDVVNAASANTERASVDDCDSWVGFPLLWGFLHFGTSSLPSSLFSFFIVESSLNLFVSIIASSRNVTFFSSG